jgi:serine/threonine protein kinase
MVAVKAPGNSNGGGSSLASTGFPGSPSALASFHRTKSLEETEHKNDPSAAGAIANGVDALQSIRRVSGCRVSIRDFDIIKPISKGAFGKVYLARKKTTGDQYAIKVLAKEHVLRKKQVCVE